MWPFKQIAEEWASIATAPTTYVLTALAIGIIAFGVSWLWHRRQIANANGSAKVHEATIGFLRAEADRMSKEITDLKKSPQPSEYNHALYGSPKVQEALLEIEEKKTMRFSGKPADWTPAQIEKFAALTRLQDAGAVDITRLYGVASTLKDTVVTSTASATAMVAIVVPGIKK